MGKHHQPDMSPDGYGKHSRVNACGLPAAELLQRIIEHGGAIRLAWRGEERDPEQGARTEFPTGVLPVIREDDEGADDDNIQPRREPHAMLEMVAGRTL